MRKPKAFYNCLVTSVIAAVTTWGLGANPWLALAVGSTVFCGISTVVFGAEE